MTYRDNEVIFTCLFSIFQMYTMVYVCELFKSPSELHSYKPVISSGVPVDVQAFGSMQVMSYFRVMLAMPNSPVKTSSFLPDGKGIVILKLSISL